MDVVVLTSGHSRVYAKNSDSFPTGIYSERTNKQILFAVVNFCMSGSFKFSSMLKRSQLEAHLHIEFLQRFWLLPFSDESNSLLQLMEQLQ